MFILRALLLFEAADFDLPPVSVIYARCEAEGINDTGGWQIKIQGYQITTKLEQKNIITIITNIIKYSTNFSADGITFSLNKQQI